MDFFIPQTYNLFYLNSFEIQKSMKCILLLFLILGFQCTAQRSISGIVIDQSTKTPVEFVSITDNQNWIGTTNAKGEFYIEISDNLSEIKIANNKYESQTIAILPNKENYLIYLKSKNTNLANNISQIIDSVISNKHKNDPKIKLNSFTFQSYNKMVVSAVSDSIPNTLDSIFKKRNNRKILKKIDSTNIKLKKLLCEQNLFQTEKQSEYQYQDTKFREIIKGTKMSGFKQPIYELLSFNLQSFSIYHSQYAFFETNYKSPISNKANKKYEYQLVDKVKIDSRWAYIIYFKSKNQSNKLYGLLFVDVQSFAICKTMIQTQSVLTIAGEYEYQYQDDCQLWFPLSSKFKISKGKNDEDIKILGETLRFDADDISIITNRKKQSSDFLFLLSENHYSDVRLNTELNIKNKHIEIIVPESAIDNNEAFWEANRKSKLNIIEENTYAKLDSITLKKRIEDKIKFGRKVINGFLPVKFIDLDLRKIISFNNYEGFRLGLGGKTNEIVSKKYVTEAYGAFGIKDGNFKYGIKNKVRLNQFSGTWLGIGYTDDIHEFGSTQYLNQKSVFKIYNPRPLNISSFYQYKGWNTEVVSAIFPKIETIWQLSSYEIEPKINYIFTPNDSYHNYRITASKINFVWSPNSAYMQTPIGRFESEKRYPKIVFQYTQSFLNSKYNDFIFKKFELKADYQHKYLNGQKTQYYFESGISLGDVPLTHLYNNSPNNITKETIVNRIIFEGKNNFETMYFNEFFSDKFVFFQIKHSLSRIKIAPKIKPYLALLNRAGWGNLENKNQHQGIAFKTLDHGYFESGLELNQIFKGLGLGFFYRYGPNQLPKLEDNIAIKLGFVLDLGI